LTKNEVGCQMSDVRRFEKPRELKIKKWRSNLKNYAFGKKLWNYRH